MSADDVWQDRDVKIDLTAVMYELRAGEILAGKWMSVEDIKENQRIKGVLSLTNLRLLWHASAAPRVNLSIGIDCIITIDNRHTKSKIEGLVEVVKVLTQCGEERREFAFKCTYKTSRGISSTLKAVHKSYKDTNAYRILSIRNPLVKSIQILAREHICTNVPGVCNLTEDQGFIGVMTITNLRIFWIALNNNLHNVSLPFLQIKNVSMHNSKFGKALTFESAIVSKGYKFGFRMDPESLMKEVFKEVKRLIETYRHKPDFGVDVMNTNTETDMQDEEDENWREDNCVIDARYDGRDVFSVLYKAGDGGEGDVEYNEELGLMMETLPPGVELQQLCRVLG